MKHKVASSVLLGLLILGATPYLASAGDSLYGKVTTVKSADVVTFNYGAGQYIIRIAGVEAPQDGQRAKEAQEFLARLLLEKNVRIRFESRNKEGEMVARLQTDDPATGIKDVGVELMKAGLVRRKPEYDYKYGELSAAEKEARTAKRGIWATR